MYMRGGDRNEGKRGGLERTGDESISFFLFGRQPEPMVVEFMHQLITLPSLQGCLLSLSLYHCLNGCNQEG